MPQSKRSLAPLETLISHSVRNDRSGTHPTQSSDKNREFCMIQNSCGRPVANPLEETPYDQGPRHRLPPVPAGCSVRARRALQGSHGSGLALGACPGMKNIGKPCTGKPDARFEEGRWSPLPAVVRRRRVRRNVREQLRVRASALLYPFADPSNQ